MADNDSSCVNSENLHLASLQGVLSIVLNFFLFLYKLIVGLQCNSIAIVADGWHSLSDSISSVILIAGVRMAEKPADKDHPFGYGRAEIIAALVIGVMLAGISFEFALDAVRKFFSPAPTELGLAAAIAMLVSILLKEGSAQYAFYLARKTGLASLHADGLHHRSDALSSVIVLAGVGLFQWFRWCWLDAALGLIVAGIIGYAAYGVLRDVTHILLGETPDRALQEKIYEICRKTAGTGLSLHHIHLHSYGSHWEMTFHVRLPGEMPLAECHTIISRMENAIRQELGIVATCHVEPLSEKPEPQGKKDGQS